MVVRKLALLIICLFGIAVSSASAQAQSEARIRVLSSRIDQIEDDLKWLIELSPTADLKKQWKKLKEDILDAFTQGMELTTPIEVDVVFRKDEIGYDLRIPVSKLEGKDSFLDSIKAFGFSKLNSVVKGVYYEISEKNKKPFYLRYDKGYAWISKVKSAVPANPPPAAQDMGALLGLNKDIIAELKNDVDGMAFRRSTFKELRKQLESLIQARRNENENAYKLRKLALVQRLDEAERFIVETDSMLVSWTTSIAGPNPFGRGEISLTALPGTDLQKGIEEIAIKPSYFANVTKPESPVLAGTVNFALDPLRIQEAKEFYKAVRPTLESEIDARTHETEAERTATKNAMNKFFDMLNAGADLKVIDGFIDVHAVEPGKNVLVTGIRAVDGNAADAIIELIPQMKSGWQVSSKVEEYAGVRIHELTVPSARVENFKKFFAGESSLYVGTSKDAVWGAAGIDAVKHLKSAIDQAILPPPEKTDPVVIEYRVQVAKVASLLEVVKLDTPTSDAQKTKDQERAQKEIEKYRKLAHDSMADCDSLMKGELRRTGDKIEGYVEINECVLRYIGSMIADGVKQME